MTIRKGTTWGGPTAPLPARASVFHSDAALASWWAAQRHQDHPLIVGLAGGDLHRTLGSPDPERMWTEAAWAFPLDLIAVTLDDRQCWGAAHVIAGGTPLFRSWTAAVMNAAFAGDANLGPRAHPNDGLLDVTIGRLSPLDRRRAAARMGHGAHLPHPALTTTRAARWEVHRDVAVAVRIDGEPVGTAHTIRVEVIPDAVTVVV